MKPDYKYMKKLFDVFLDSALPTVDWNSFEGAREDEDEDEHKFVFHIELMADRDLLTSVEGDSLGIHREFCGPSYEYAYAIVQWRLTADGHDFATALANKEILNVICSEFKEEGMSVVAAVAKRISGKYLDKKLGILLGE